MYALIGLAAWVLSTLACYRLAVDKNYPPAAGVLLGLLLGVIGMLIMLVVPTRRREP